MMPHLTAQLTLLLSLSMLACSQYLVIDLPTEASKTLVKSKIKVRASPIGFKPRVGSLHGRIFLADPISACEAIKAVDFEEDQDVFVLADDQGCMESVKAKNIAESGAYIGIIKKNYNQTAHDREIDTVHIPILEIEPADFNTLLESIKTNKEGSISALADFNPEDEQFKMRIELWMSPTQVEAYNYVNQLSGFLSTQEARIRFHPRFVLHSQGKNAQYLGCLSSGRFCPPELQFEANPAGTKIVSQALRQIIIAQKDIKKWYSYAQYYSTKCLRQNRDQLWQQQNSQLCSENAMMMAQVDPQEIFTEVNASYLGPRPDVDSNTYLQQQRQLYLQQKISQFPILFINDKPYPLADNPSAQLKKRICTMIHPNPSSQPPECQQLHSPSLFSTGQLMIIFAFLINFLICLMIGCRVFIRRRMQSEIHAEVDGTLAQYYRYMETFEEPDPNNQHYLVEGQIKEKEKEKKEGNLGDSVEISEKIREDGRLVRSVEMSDYGRGK